MFLLRSDPEQAAQLALDTSSQNQTYWPMSAKQSGLKHMPAHLAAQQDGPLAGRHRSRSDVNLRCREICRSRHSSLASWITVSFSFEVPCFVPKSFIIGHMQKRTKGQELERNVIAHVLPIQNSSSGVYLIRVMGLNERQGKCL